ncbi:MAG: hypothetical protein U0414_01930 [Polyangiaceae bacterium]
MHRRVFLGTALASAGALAVGCEPGPVVGSAPLATGQAGIWAIVADDFFLYWTVFSGEVRRVSLDGGAVETLAKFQAGPSSIAIDATDVFFTGGDGTVARVPKKGGETSVLTTAVDTGNIAVDDAFVYFTAGSVIKRVAKAGAAAEDLATNEVNPSGLVVAGTLMWAREGTTGTSSDGAIREVSVGGGTANSVVANIKPNRFARGSKHLVWTEFGDGLVRAASTDGSDVRDLTLVDPGVERLGALIADDDNAYFGTDAGTLRVVSLTGTATAQTITTGQAGRFALASDMQYVYAAKDTTGNILAIAKALHATPQE